MLGQDNKLLFLTSQCTLR